MLRVVRRLLAARERTGDGRARRHRHALVLTRSDGSVQAAYDGHPLYTYVGDSLPDRPMATGST